MFCSGGRAWRTVVTSVIAAVSLGSLTVAQPVLTPNPASFNPQQIERLVAPIALYPDPLVAQILMAATYPLEIVEADRWLLIPANAALHGDALAAALQQRPWDPSVKSLLSFPQVLHMMDRNLDWTEQLGDAFLAQQGEVMDAIQRLRQRAEAAGSLISMPQQSVATEEQEILIEPASPGIVYVPTYNPWCVYGPWPYSDYPPFYFEAWAGTCAPADYFIGFGNGFYPFAFWAWGRFEWRHHIIRVDYDQFQRFQRVHEPPGGIWQHDPVHRHGVPYRDLATAARFLGPGSARRGYRGFAPPLEATPPVKPAAPSLRSAPPAGGRSAPIVVLPQRPVPPAFQSFGPGPRVRGESGRGSSSRMSPPAAPAPSFHPPPAPSFHAPPIPHFSAPAPSFHGGVGGGGRR